MKRLYVLVLAGLLTLFGAALAFDADDTIPIGEALATEVQAGDQAAERQQEQTEGADEAEGAQAETAVDPAGFDTLLSLLESAGMLEQLNQDGPYTLFAPPNAAFENLEAAQLEMLRSDPQALQSVLGLHVVQGAYTINELQDAGTVQTLSGESLTVHLEADGLEVNDASFSATDVDNSYANGIIHVVEEVILPEGMQRSQEQTTDQPDGGDATDTDAPGTEGEDAP